MKLFRNPEISAAAAAIIIISAAAIVCGYIVSPLAALVVAIACAALCAVFIAFTWRRYTRIAKLADRLDELLRGDLQWEISDLKEGELSILQTNIRKLVAVLQSSADSQKKNRLALADSLTDISHQLRTPLTSIGIVADILRRPDLPDEKRSELSRELAVLTSRMDSLLSSLLKLSKLDAGMVTFHCAPIDMARLAEKSAEPINIAAELRGQRLVMRGDDARVMCDEAWTCEAIGNVLKNCVEHTPFGGVISVEWTDNPLFCEFLISDTGNGIDPGDLPHIFQRFYRGKGDSAGFGVGLALSRNIISMQNGTIKAANALSGGTLFTIRFYKRIV